MVVRRRKKEWEIEREAQWWEEKWRGALVI